VVHNRYRSEMPSGENRVVDDEIEMLRKAGVEVITYLRSSDEIPAMGVSDRLNLPVSPIINFRSARELRALIRAERPDVLHLHNPYPLISPWVVRVAKSEDLPVVQTVHNFRHICMNGLFFRDGRICRDCEGKALGWPGVRHSCYRDSRAQSAVMAATLSLHRSTWQQVDQFLPVSQFIADVMIASGVPGHRITVKPNGIPDPGPPPPIGPPAVLFLGRLSEEKGIDLLLEAWRRADLPKEWSLRVAGDGPLRSHVEMTTTKQPSVEYVGPIDASALRGFFAGGRVLAVPSIWYEGFPRVLAESFAHGRPALVSDVGGLPSAVSIGSGRVIHPSADSWSKALSEQPACDWEQASRIARTGFQERLVASAVVGQLRGVYQSVVASS
jgi:glycosyltransferase involved in cell wall biosynthesis